MRRTLSKPADPGPFREDFDEIMGRDPLKARNEKPGMFEDWKDAAKVLGPVLLALTLLLYVIAISVL